MAGSRPGCSKVVVNCLPARLRTAEMPGGKDADLLVAEQRRQRSQRSRHASARRRAAVLRQRQQLLDGAPGALGVLLRTFARVWSAGDGVCEFRIAA